MDKNLLDITAVAQQLNIPVSGVRALVFQKRIPYLKIGRRIRFCPQALDKWLDLNSTSKKWEVKNA
jgi:excisionase family DNA binding protein